MKVITQRQFYAGLAMQAYIMAEGQDGSTARGNPSTLAEWSFEHADAMLKHEANEDERLEHEAKDTNR